MHVIDLSTFDTGPPVVHELPQQVHVVLGEEFQITCTATNDQDAPSNLIFSWKALYRRIQFNETTTDEDDSRVASSTLHISRVTNNDDGRYQCSVSNGGRSEVSISTLIVEGLYSQLVLYVLPNHTYVTVPSSLPRSLKVSIANISSLKLKWSMPRKRRGEIDYYTVSCGSCTCC